MNLDGREFYNNMFRENPNRWEPWDRPMHPFDENVKNMIEELTQYRSDCSWLIDLGCGNGRTLKVLCTIPHVMLFGVDFSEEAIKQAVARRLSAIFQIDDMTHTKFPESYFDFVISVGSFEHQEVLDFSEPRRLIKDNGYFICVLPDVKESKGLTLAADKQHQDWELTKEDWIVKIEPYGFKFIEYREPWTFVFKPIN